jgi:hypothetical protein
VRANEVRVAYGDKIRSGRASIALFEGGRHSRRDDREVFFASFCWRRWWSESASCVIAMARSS